ncbi:MAG: hypothetical protein AAGA69_02525, partial [Pseudomonadota bacterium]
MRIVTTGLDRPTGTQLRAVRLGYTGLVPFGLGAAITWLSPGLISAEFAARFVGWVILYGAIILSFMG